MTPRRAVVLVLVDAAVVAGASVAVGATAPRWPRAWLRRDVGPLRLRAWETPEAYRRVGVTHLTARLPELGAAFGGASKAALPGTTVEALDDYLVEVRRAEWVHLASALTWLPLAAFNPPWLTGAFAAVAVGANVPFLIVLRHNRLRLTRLVGRLAARSSAYAA